MVEKSTSECMNKVKRDYKKFKAALLWFKDIHIGCKKPKYVIEALKLAEGEDS